MYTIVGLGNPGKEYEHTRHNIGWLVLQEIRERGGMPEPAPSSRYLGLVSEGNLGNTPVALLFPTTFMNNSGNSVARFLKEKGSPRELVVVHDEVDLAFGDIKVSYGRGAGGHNGVKSVMDVVGGNEFARLRVGIAKKRFFGGIKRPRGEDLPDFVLKNLSGSELRSIPGIAEKVEKAIMLILEKGVEAAMQECN